MPEPIETIARRWWDEGLNKHNVALADELMDAEYILHDATFGDIKGRDAFKQFVNGLFLALPDAQYRIEDVVTAGDKCAVRYTFSGTQHGEIMSIAPTGRRVTDVSAIAMVRILGGRHVEAWQVFDFLGMLRQLGAAPESTEANKAVARRYVDEFLNKADWSVADEIFAEDYVCHGPHLPEVHGPEAMKEFHMALRASVPDVRFAVIDLLAEGDKVAMHWQETGTMMGEWMGIAPTGKSYRVTGIDTLRLAGGKIVEEHAEIDFLGFLEQIGVVTLPGQANIQAAG